MDINLILSMAPALTSVVSIAIGVSKVVLNLKKHEDENEKKIAKLNDKIIAMTKEFGDVFQSLKGALKTVLTENAELKRQLREEREKATGVKE